MRGTEQALGVSHLWTNRITISEWTLWIFPIARQNKIRNQICKKLEIMDGTLRCCMLSRAVLSALIHRGTSPIREKKHENSVNMRYGPRHARHSGLVNIQDTNRSSLKLPYWYCAQLMPLVPSVWLLVERNTKVFVDWEIPGDEMKFMRWNDLIHRGIR